MLLKLKDVAVVTLLLLLSHLGSVDADGATCEKNLNCCRHLPGSEAFKQCCNDDCCPDCEQVAYVSAMKSYAIKKECEASYECCVYKVLSKEWLSCCSKHPCCKLCHKVSKGCCYSGKMYRWGSTVTSVPEMDTNLVCGVKVSKTPPYFVATVVPVLHSAPHGDKCKEPCRNDCVEENGIIHVNGSEWFRNTCSLCHCDGGVVTCRMVRPACPPAPYPQCVPVNPAPGDCCNAWDCSRLENMCIDAYGKVRQEGEQWTGRNDPCLLYMCKAGGMVLSARRSCPQPHVTVPPGCKLLTPPHQCCPVLHCPECEDKGVSYSAGDSWPDSKDPCYTQHCMSGGIVRRVKKECPHLDRPAKDNCVLVHDGCCPVWVCGGCVDRSGKVHALGSTWTDADDPCINYQCSDRGVRLASRSDCPPLGSPPDPTCRRTKKDCCYVWSCVGNKTHCIDDQGLKRNAGEEWVDPENPCVFCSCLEDFQIQKAVRDCARPLPQPRPNCIMVVEQCCPIWKCPCVDATGVEKHVGEVWKHPTNVCMSLECTSDGVTERILPCPELPHRPDPSCELHFDGCCRSWKCPAQCPDPSSFNRNCIQFFNQCYWDGQCRQGEKCCLVAGCGNECMIVPKPGKCPIIRTIVAPQCDPDIRNACEVDQDCGGTMKCCFLLCNKQCVEP